MGSTVNLRCTKCDLSGDGLSVGAGITPISRFIENRLFYCGRCNRLATATVLRRVADLRGELAEMDAKPWSTAAMGEVRLTFMPSELARLLIQMKIPPQCACGAWLRGSVCFEGKETRCPKCAAELTVEEVGLWD